MEASMDQEIQHPLLAPLADSHAQKRPYTSPRLTVHGNVAELTLQVKTGTLPDVESAGSHPPALL
jgi:hypothetical protein